MAYTLTRVCPDGSTRTVEGLRTRRETGVSAFYTLLDNQATTNKREATKAAALVEDAEPGTPVLAFGYTFTVAKDGA